MSGRYKPVMDGGETICLCPHPRLDKMNECSLCRRLWVAELSPGIPHRGTRLVQVAPPPRPPPPDLGTFTMTWDEAG